MGPVLLVLIFELFVIYNHVYTTFSYENATTTLSFNQVGDTCCHTSEEFLDYQLCGMLGRYGADP